MRNYLLVFLLIIFACSAPKQDAPKQEKPQVEKKEIPLPKRVQQKDFTQGLYLTAWTVSSSKFETILDSAQAAGINTIVFDLKNMNGHIFFNYSDSNNNDKSNIKPIFNMEKVVEKIHQHEMRAVARLVMFHDQHMAKLRPEWRPQKKDGTAWRESKKLKPSWLDSSHPDVQKRLLNLIDVVSDSTIDEIQLDYVRFPTQGNLSEAIFHFQAIDKRRSVSDSTYVKREKSDIIKDFVRRAQAICSKKKVTLTGDLFAIIAWQSKNDVKNTGQSICKITHHFQSIHPMIYPSHFAKDFSFRKNIWDEPYYIVYKATKLTQENSQPSCKVTPYIQANEWRAHYTKKYVYAQIQAIIDRKADGYILWNASNKFLKTLRWIKNFE